jgi:hypothetical protein
MSASAEEVQFWNVQSQAACGIMALDSSKADGALHMVTDVPPVHYSFAAVMAFREAEARGALYSVADDTTWHGTLAFAPNGHHLAMTYEGTACVWNTSTRAIHSTLNNVLHWATWLVFLPNS